MVFGEEGPGALRMEGGQLQCINQQRTALRSYHWNPESEGHSLPDPQSERLLKGIKGKGAFLQKLFNLYSLDYMEFVCTMIKRILNLNVC
jgi:hypothetical protein